MVKCAGRFGQRDGQGKEQEQNAGEGHAWTTWRLTELAWRTRSVARSERNGSRVFHLELLSAIARANMNGVRTVWGHAGSTCEARRANLLGGGEGGDGEEHVFFAHDEVCGVEGGELEAVAVGDGVGGAGLDTVATEDAAVVIDVVDLGVALRGGDADFLSVFGGLDEDAVGGAGGGAKEAGDTFFEAVFVTLEDVGSAVALLEDRSTQGAFAVRVVLNLRGLQHLPEGDAHTFNDAGYVAHDRHEASIRWRRILFESGKWGQAGQWRAPGGADLPWLLAGGVVTGRRSGMGLTSC